MVRLKLVRSQDVWHRGEWCTDEGRWVLCRSGVNEYFNIPKEVNEIDLLLSARRMPESYRLVVQDYNEIDVYVGRKRVGQDVTVLYWFTHHIHRAVEEDEDIDILLSDPAECYMAIEYTPPKKKRR